MSIVPDKNRARIAETIGLLIVALVILAVTLVRYARLVHWGWR